jgi:hypothetical protein
MPAVFCPTWLGLPTFASFFPRKAAGLGVFGHVMTAATNGTPSPASIVNVGDVLLHGDNAC